MLDDSVPLRKASMTGRQRWTILVASTGGALEVFDFVIFGFFARNIGNEFFPPRIGVSAMTLSFTVLAIGYLSRPLGGLILGRFGDTHGRRPVFVASAMIASVSTLLIGILPSYAAWGAPAWALLLTLRLIQGFCLGGELPGAVVYAFETTHSRPGLMCGFVFVAVNLALLLATSVNLAVQWTFPAEQVNAFGWRIGFVLGGMVGLLSFGLRRTLAETDEYAQAVGARHREPLAVLFRVHFAPLTKGAAACLLVGASGGTFIGFMPAYLQGLQYDARQIASAQACYLIVVAACILVTSHVGDLLPRRYVFRSGAVLSALFTPFFFIAVANHYASLLVLYLIAGVIASLANGTFACAIADMFSVDVRFSGVATAMNLGLAVPVALTPLAANMLASGLHWTPAPALVMVLCSALAFAASFGMNRGPRRAEFVDTARRERT
jgi:MFS family permease